MKTHSKKWLRIEKHPEGRRVYILNRRVHHLELGLLLIFIGWILVLHDWILERRKLQK